MEGHGEGQDGMLMSYSYTIPQTTCMIMVIDFTWDACMTCDMETRLCKTELLLFCCVHFRRFLPTALNNVRCKKDRPARARLTPRDAAAPRRAVQHHSAPRLS